MRAFDMIFREGYYYKKAGCFVSGIVPAEPIQSNMFDLVDRTQESVVSNVLDVVNKRYGRDSIRLGVQGVKREWRLRQENLSQRFTTRWDELLVVKV